MTVSQLSRCYELVVQWSALMDLMQVQKQKDKGITLTVDDDSNKKDVKELLAKSALLGLLGSWGRVKNYRYSLITTSNPDDIPWSGDISSKPTPFSERTETGYVFQDITWRQEVKNLGTFLPLNLIGRRSRANQGGNSFGDRQTMYKTQPCTEHTGRCYIFAASKKGVQEAPRRI